MKNWISIICDWYTKNKRILPWRESKDPYKIWVSEILLQQTRVEQALDYYNRFVQIFPDVFSLANASVEDVLFVWRGLGYYRRALNMHQTAKLIVMHYHGILPNSYNELLKLKGIGKYTAAAIASICFDEKVYAIDSNVHRIFSRFYAQPFAKDEKKFEDFVRNDSFHAMEFYAPGDVNQAMMDFGAIVCKPNKPLCNECVINKHCLALKNNSVNSFPLRTKKSKTTLYHYYFYIHSNGYCYLYQRVENDVWKHMFEFPLIVYNKKTNLDIKNIPFLANLKIRNIHKTKPLKHVLSHRIIEATLYLIEVDNLLVQNDWLIVPNTAIKQFPISKLMEKLIKQIL